MVAGPPAQELTHNAGNQATGGIWRVEGPADRAVLKIATADGGGDAAWATSERGDHWNYWRREPLAYQTGFVHRVYAEAGLGAPGLLAAVEPSPGTLALWLEDVAGLPGPRRPVARLADLAERLGRAQAGWAGRDPPYPWLSRRWLRQYVTRQPIGEPVAWDHPLASAAWPPELRAGLRRPWRRRAELLDLAEALPQTTCHLDVWPMTLVARGGGLATRWFCWTGRSPAPGRSARPSIRRSAVTTLPASSSSRTSNARSRRPPTVTSRPSACHTCVGPRMPKRMPWIMARRPAGP